jgi:hypothetical protein
MTMTDPQRFSPRRCRCEGLPEEFATHISYTRSLGFRDKPNYAYLRQRFRRALLARGYKYDNVFDWTARLFHETQGDIGPVAERPRDQEDEFWRRGVQEEAG